MSLPATNPVAASESSLIAGSVLPIQRAEELLATLPGVISARILAGPSGNVEEIHILTTTDVTPKQTVRNVESALIAHLGMHVSHKKISVATSDATEAQRSQRNATNTLQLQTAAGRPEPLQTGPALAVSVTPPTVRRRIYFEDVEVRRSRAKGITCRVTLRKDEETYVGEAEGMENPRMRIELAARAALSAIKQVEGDGWIVALEGCKVVDAFERQFVFVAIVTSLGREDMLMTGSAEIRESPETSSALAVLDATNRWLDRNGDR